jgi:RNA polymerase sigma-70 factor (ECF subfamily)
MSERNGPLGASIGQDGRSIAPVGDDAAAPGPALVQLVADYHEALYRYAYRLSGSAPDAEDLTQQVFLIAQQKLDQVRDAQCVRGWLFTVLRNCYLKGRRKGLGLPVCELDVNTVPQAPPADLIDSEELQTAIDTLGDEFKLVVLQFYFEHRSYREIADCLGIPLGTVMSRLARAKSHLRNYLSDGAESNGTESNGAEPNRTGTESSQHELPPGVKRGSLPQEVSPLTASHFHQPTVARR